MRQKTSQEKVNLARKLWDEGMTYQEIGKIMNYSPEWVRQLLMRTDNFFPRPAHKIANREIKGIVLPE